MGLAARRARADPADHRRSRRRRACGAFNGALVACIGLPSIVVTIGTMSLFRGIAQVVLGDQAMTNYPGCFQSIGQDY